MEIDTQFHIPGSHELEYGPDCEKCGRASLITRIPTDCKFVRLAIPLLVMRVKDGEAAYSYCCGKAVALPGYESNDEDIMREYYETKSNTCTS